MDDTLRHSWRKLENVIEDAVAYLQRQEDGLAQQLASELQEQARKMDHAIRADK